MKKVFFAFTIIAFTSLTAQAQLQAEYDDDVKALQSEFVHQHSTPKAVKKEQKSISSSLFSSFGFGKKEEEEKKPPQVAKKSYVSQQKLLSSDIKISVASSSSEVTNYALRHTLIKKESIQGGVKKSYITKKAIHLNARKVYILKIDNTRNIYFFNN